MYRWWKFARPSWVDQHEEILRLRTNDTLAIIERSDCRRLLVEATCSSLPASARLVQEFGGRTERLPRDWLARYARAQRGRPIKIGRRLVILKVGARSTSRSSPQILLIPATAAFGTGKHATTGMCLRLLEQISRPWPTGWSLCDAGTGTGILALAAHRFGARNVCAIDHDPLAIAIAQENARLNAIDGVRFITGNLLEWTPGNRSDIITANLFSELLMAALPVIKNALKASSCAILSGILRDQTERVVRLLRRGGFSVEEMRRRGKWIALVARLKT